VDVCECSMSIDTLTLLMGAAKAAAVAGAPGAAPAVRANRVPGFHKSVFRFLQVPRVSGRTGCSAKSSNEEASNQSKFETHGLYSWPNA